MCVRSRVGVCAYETPARIRVCGRTLARSCPCARRAGWGGGSCESLRVGSGVGGAVGIRQAAQARAGGGQEAKDWCALLQLGACVFSPPATPLPTPPPTRAFYWRGGLHVGRVRLRSTRLECTPILRSEDWRARQAAHKCLEHGQKASSGIRSLHPIVPAAR